MPVEARRIETVEAFLDTAGPFLVAREPEHQLMLAIVEQRRAEGSWPPDGALVAALEGDRVVGAAIWTPPWNVVLSEVHDERAIDAIAESLAGDRIPGVLAPADGAEPFARAWTARSGGTYLLTMRQRSYLADAITPPDGVPGAMRLARPTDRDLLLEWMVAFDTEALGSDAGRQDLSAVVDDVLGPSARTAYIWDVAGQPVSMCRTVGQTPHGVRIGGVYTPPDQRRHGYAGAITAAASRHHLDEGRRWCFLFADLANPSANGIYAAIGYRPIHDVDLIRFSPA